MSNASGLQAAHAAQSALRRGTLNVEYLAECYKNAEREATHARFEKVERCSDGEGEEDDEAGDDDATALLRCSLHFNRDAVGGLCVSSRLLAIGGVDLGGIKQSEPSDAFCQAIQDDAPRCNDEIIHTKQEKRQRLASELHRKRSASLPANCIGISR